MINIDDLTLKELKELARFIGKGLETPTQRLPMTVGMKVFVRTVTHHYSGRVVEVAEREVALEDAAWIADDGRFAEALRTGEFKEIEPYPGRVVVSRDAILDWSEFAHELPREVK